MRYFCLASVIGLFIVISWTFTIHPDERVFMQAAQALHQGQTLYVEFFDHKPPNIYLMWYLLNSLIQDEWWLLVSMRSLVALVNVMTAWLMFQLSNTLYSRKKAFISSVVYLLTLWQFQGQFSITEPYMVFFLLLGIWLYVKDRSTSQLIVILSGISFGLAMLFKQVALVNIFIFTLLIIVNQKKDSISFLCGISLALLWVMLIVLPMTNFRAMIHAVFSYNFFEYKPFDPWITVKQLPRLLGLTIPLWMLFTYILLKKLYYSLKNMHIFRISKKLVQSYSTTNKQQRVGMMKQIVILFATIPLPLMFFRPYHHYWLQILPFVIMVAAVVKRHET